MKNRGPFIFHKKHRVAAFCFFALVMVGCCLQFYNYYWKKKHQNANALFTKNNLGKKEGLYAFEDGEQEWEKKEQIGQFSYTFGPKKAHKATLTCYYKKSTGNMVAYLTRTTIKRGEEPQKDYYIITSLYKEDTHEVHRVIKESGEAYFGREDYYKQYGISKEGAERNILEASRQGCFHAKDPKGPFKFVGFVKLSSIIKPGETKKFKTNKNGSYGFGSPGVTHTQAAGLACFWGYTTFYIHFDKDTTKQIILSMNKKNTKSKNIAEQLRFKRVPSEYYYQSTDPANAISYAIDVKDWPKK